MVRLEGGPFLMGTDDSLGYPADGEGPVTRHPAPVPNRVRSRSRTRASRQFVDETGHVTAAEQFGWSFVFGGLLPDEFEDTRGVAEARGGGRCTARTGRIRKGRSRT